jgi:hypothetical protein
MALLWEEVTPFAQGQVPASRPIPPRISKNAHAGARANQNLQVLPGPQLLEIEHGMQLLFAGLD